jgi:carbohydrate ABC transporter substrate-binding protein, CUT1 family (TC 3.A.1.1.-)
VPKSQWNATFHAALLFIEFMTNYTNEMNLWNYARDIPALKSAYNYAISQLSQPAPNQTVACLNQVMKGVLEQSLHGQKFPNIPQMAYYWTSFGRYALWYFSFRNLSAVQAAQGMESYFISQLQANGLLDPAPIAALENLMVAELPASRY